MNKADAEADLTTIIKVVQQNKGKGFTFAVLVVLLLSMFVSLISPSVHASGPITLVQGPVRGKITSGSSITANLANTPVSGNVLIATVGVSTYPIHVSSITETGVTWTLDVQKNDTSGDLDCEIWQGIVDSGAGTSITVALNAPASKGGIVDVCEWSGLSTSSLLDQTASTSFPSGGYGSQTGSTGTTAQTTQAYELCIGAIMDNDGVHAQTNPTNGFIMLDGLQMAYLYNIVGAVGAYSSGTTFRSGSTLWAGCIATFKAASANPYPLVTLDSPVNCTAYAHDPVSFYFTPEYATSAQLWMNVSGTWQSVASTSTITNGQQNSISYLMPQNSNSYVWNIEVLNSASAGTAFAPHDFIITDSPLPSGMGLVADGSNLLNSTGQVVQLRGVGLEGFAPDLLFWASTGSDNWGDQWQPANSAAVTQTLHELSTVWHVNMIRFFIYPEWWMQNNVSPYYESAGSHGTKGQTVSTQSYIETLASECESYGIYLDVCPYSLTAGSSAFNDTYGTSTNGTPMSNSWSTQEQAYLTAEGYGSNEAGYWTAFWASMANALKGYPNVIFEAYNEPTGNGIFTNLVQSGYLQYLQITYNAIRAAGATNPTMMMWWDGWEPNGWGQNMAWAGQIASAIGDPTNIVYNNHLYYYAPSDGTRYWDQGGVDNNAGGKPRTTAQLETSLSSLLGTMGISAPVVMNEEGDCSLQSANVTNDYVWWSNLLQAQDALGIGSGAYYWLSSSGLGGTFDGNELLTSGYTPNTMGQEYINAYIS